MTPKRAAENGNPRADIHSPPAHEEEPVLTEVCGALVFEGVECVFDVVAGGAVGLVVAGHVEDAEVLPGEYRLEEGEELGMGG